MQLATTSAAVVYAVMLELGLIFLAVSIVFFVALPFATGWLFECYGGRVSELETKYLLFPGAGLDAAAGAGGTSSRRVEAIFTSAGSSPSRRASSVWADATACRAWIDWVLAALYSARARESSTPGRIFDRTRLWTTRRKISERSTPASAALTVRSAASSVRKLSA